MLTRKFASTGTALALAAAGLVAAPLLGAAPAQALPVCSPGVAPGQSYFTSAGTKHKVFVTNAKAPQVSLPEGTKFKLRAKASFSVNGSFKGGAGASLGGILKKVGLKASVSANASAAVKASFAAGVSLSGTMPRYLPGRQVRAKLGTTAWKVNYTVRHVNVRTCKTLSTSKRTATVFPKYPNLEMRYFKD